MCNESCAAWIASGNEADMVKFKGRVMKLKKEMASTRSSMEESSIKEHKATFIAKEAVSHFLKFVNLHFDNAMGNCFVDALDLN